MILLENLFSFLEFCATNNTYIQHTADSEGLTNRFSRFPLESATGQQTVLGYPRLEVLQLPLGAISNSGSADRDDLDVRLRVIYSLADKYDYSEQTTKMDQAKQALMEIINYIQTAQETGQENSLICAFDVTSVRYQFIDKATYGGDGVGCEMSLQFKQYINWAEVSYGTPPSYPTFCDAVEACLGISPSGDDNKYLNEKGEWVTVISGGGVVIEKTKAEFLALASGGTLTYPATYKITDIENGLFVNTLNSSSYSQLCTLSLNCPKTYETTTVDGNVWKGIWRASKTANINDLFIWGGVVWKNLTGNIGTATDLVTLDATNWEYIDRNNFSNNEYIPLSLICFYNFEQGWVNYLQDEHSNIIGVDWHSNQEYGLAYNPALHTDWNVMTSGVIFSNNQLFFIANNLANVVSNKTNGFIYNNDGGVLDNKFCSVIANNEQDVYENIASDLDIDGAVNEVFSVNGSRFFFTHNFSSSPLSAGSSVLYNYIPTGTRINSITASGTINGSEIKIGLETDDEGLINDVVGLLPISFNGVSNAATANRSLKIEAVGGDITTGTLTVKVEFIL